MIWDTANPRSLQTYRVEYTPTHWNNQTVSIYVNDTSVNISDFYLNTTYSIVVEAINEHGTSRSNVSYFITPYEGWLLNVWDFAILKYLFEMPYPSQKVCFFVFLRSGEITTPTGYHTPHPQGITHTTPTGYHTRHTHRVSHAYDYLLM